MCAILCSLIPSEYGFAIWSCLFIADHSKVLLLFGWIYQWIMLIVSCYQVGFTSFGTCRRLFGSSRSTLCSGLSGFIVTLQSRVCRRTFLSRCHQSLRGKCMLLCSIRALCYWSPRQELNDWISELKGPSCHHHLPQVIWAYLLWQFFEKWRHCSEKSSLQGHFGGFHDTFWTCSRLKTHIYLLQEHFGRAMKCSSSCVWCLYHSRRQKNSDPWKVLGSTR